MIKNFSIPPYSDLEKPVIVDERSGKEIVDDMRRKLLNRKEVK